MKKIKVGILAAVLAIGFAAVGSTTTSAGGPTDPKCIKPCLETN